MVTWKGREREVEDLSTLERIAVALVSDRQDPY
jgi:hypothetical protein